MSIKTSLGGLFSKNVSFEPTPDIPRSNVQDAVRYAGNVMSGGVPSTDAPSSASYIVSQAESGLSNERVATNTGTVTWDFTTPGQALANWEFLGLEDLSDPGADRGLFWDDSSGSFQFFAGGTGLGFVGSYLSITDPDLVAIVDEASFAAGDILYHNGTTLARLAAGTDGQFLRTRGNTGTAPDWQNISGGGDMLRANNLSDLASASSARTNLGLAIGTNVQAWDAQLDSLSSASANGVSLVTAADYAAMRALLDLEVGTDFLSPAAIAAAYQPLDTDLTSWAGVTRSAGFDTFAATPSSANLAALVTGETGSGALVFGTSPGFTTAANPASNDGAALGTTSLCWSDLFLAGGGVIDWASGDVTISHGGNSLIFSGATTGYTFSNGPINVATGVSLFNPGSVIAGNGPGISFVGHTDTGIAANSDNFAFWESGTIALNLSTPNKEFRIPSDFKFAWASSTNNNTASDTYMYRLSADVVASSGDLYADNYRVGPAGVITWNSGDVTITHSTNTLTFAGATTYAFDVAPSVGGTAVLLTSAIGSTVQAYDADLSSWAAITRASGFDTFVATPSSANLASLVTDETGSGSLVFGTSPGFTTAASPVSNDGATLGTSLLKWSDLYLATGGFIDFGGDTTITHSTARLTFADAEDGWHFDGTGYEPAIIMKRLDAHGDAQQLGGWLTKGKNSSGTETYFTKIFGYCAEDAAGAEYGGLYFHVAVNGVMTQRIGLYNNLFYPDVNDTMSLGASGYGWSDLFLASGAVINWNSDVTLTHSSNRLDLLGADYFVFGQNAAAPTFIIERTDNHGSSAYVGAFDFYGRDAGNASQKYAGISAYVVDATATSEDSSLRFTVTTAGTVTEVMGMHGTSLYPITNDGMALGGSSNAWSDLHLASGGTINFNNGAVVLNHVSADDVLRLDAGCFRIYPAADATQATPTTYAYQLTDAAGGFVALSMGYDGTQSVIQSWNGKALHVNPQGNAAVFGAGGLSSTGAIRAYSGTATPAGGTAGVGLTMGSTSNLGLFFGTGAPTLSAAKGSLYVCTDATTTTTRLYINTNGTTTWTNFTSAA